MGLNTVLQATTREVKTSNYATRLRKEGLLPAVFYGPGVSPAKNITVSYKEFKNAFLNTDGNKSLFTLTIDGHEPEMVVLKDYQVNPLSRKVIHADFYKIDPTKTITVKVPLVLTGKPVGVEKGGQLQQGGREALISGLPANIPAEIVVDVSALGLGQVMHLSDLVLAEGLKVVVTHDLAVATVTIPKGMKAGAEEEGTDKK